jgi:hypothetical protein
VPAALTAIALPALWASPAAAEQCGNGFIHIGQLSQETTTWEGIERYITDTNPVVSDQNNQHMAEWLGMTDTRQGCQGQILCWLQDGYCIGACGQYIFTIPIIYLEINGIDKPYQTIPRADLTIATDTFFNDFFSHTYDGYGQPIFYGYVNVGGGPQFLGSVGLPHVQNRADANGESATRNASPTKECPAVDSFLGKAYYGTDNVGNYNVNNALFKSADGTSWEEWLNQPSFETSSLYSKALIHNFSAFSVAGGG